MRPSPSSSRPFWTLSDTRRDSHLYAREVGTALDSSNRLVRWVLGLTIAAGGAGVVMRIFGVHSAIVSTLVLLFLAVAPTAAIYGLLHSFDPFARIILACTLTVVFLTLMATLMLAEGVWSPLGGLLVVTGITLACFVAQWPPVKRQLAGATTHLWRRTNRNRLDHAGAADRQSNDGER